MSNSEKNLTKSIFLKYLLFSALLIIIDFLFKKILNFKQLLYNSLAEKLTNSQIQIFFKNQEGREYIGYLFIILIFFLKTILITSIVYTGIFFLSRKQVFFNQILNRVLKAEFIFLLVPVFKIVWFYFFETNYKLEDIQYFYPLSAINITGYSGLEQWLIYPFQVLNLFELGYILYLGYELGKLTETNHDKGLKIMAYSYVPMMVLWIVVVMFFALSYS